MRGGREAADVDPDLRHQNRIRRGRRFSAPTAEAEPEIQVPRVVPMGNRSIMPFCSGAYRGRDPRDARP
jgi:hypothetical protein